MRKLVLRGGLRACVSLPRMVTLGSILAWLGLALEALTRTQGRVDRGPWSCKEKSGVGGDLQRGQGVQTGKACKRQGGERRQLECAEERLKPPEQGREQRHWRGDEEGVGETLGDAGQRRDLWVAERRQEL